MAKQQPDLVIDRLGTHLFRVTRKNGSVSFKWDWDKLLAEVQSATSGALVKAGTKKKAVAKKDLVKETETKVAVSRTKKAPITKTKATKKKAD